MNRVSRTGLRRIAPSGSTRTSPVDDNVPVAKAKPGVDVLTEVVLYTADQAAGLLQVRPSWLRRKAAAGAVPCRHVGKHLRFSRADIDAITEASSWPRREG